MALEPLSYIGTRRAAASQGGWSAKGFGKQARRLNTGGLTARRSPG